MENIKKIILSLNEDGKIKRMVVVGEDKIERYSRKNLSNDEIMRIYTNYVNILKNQYKIQLDGLNTDKEQVNKLASLGVIERNEHFFDYDEPENDNEVEDNYVESSKIKNFIVNHPYISAAIVTGATFVIVHSGIKLAKKNYNTKDNKNKTTMELQLPEETKKPEFEFVQETKAPRITPKHTVTSKTTVKPKDTSSKISFLYHNSNFTYPEPSSNKILMRKVNGEEYFSFNDNLESLMEIRNYNMDSVANKVQSDIEIDNDGMYIYYENLFNDYDIKDKAFVKYFSRFGNQIIKCAYQDNNFDLELGVNKFAKQSCYDFIRYVRDNEPLSVYIDDIKQDIYYSELSKDAKEAVLNIAVANYTALNSYPELYKDDPDREESLIIEINYKNEEITKADVLDIIINAYNELHLTK